ncbi:methyltransferase dimerization domain-containing protein [Desulfoluna sp.]|uniref:methyltransferase family protein n=1 Tax=Desulfoluna sp. TaxID=2045199 RepID=UPI00262AE051|nr:methyltransferase dimerization domain-containing protein [Desulfoluna sp.]
MSPRYTRYTYAVYVPEFIEYEVRHSPGGPSASSIKALALPPQEERTRMHIPHVTAPFRPVHRILAAGCGTRILQAAMELRLFDELSKGPATPEELAAIIQSTPHQTEALLEVLRSLELVEREGRAYQNAPCAHQYLVQSSDNCQAPFISMLTGLYDSALSDIPSRMKNAHGEKEKMEKGWATPEVLEGMGRASLRGPVQATLSFVQNLPGFDEATTLCDMGGNHGFYSMALLDANPRLYATVCDLPHVTGPARKLHEKYGYAKRMEVKNLNLETESPDGVYDIIFASHILYSWKGRMSEVIGKLSRSLKPGGWLVLNHMAPTEGKPNPINALMAFHATLSGYPSHSLSQHELETACDACGLKETTTAFDDDSWALLFAARKPMGTKI